MLSLSVCLRLRNLNPRFWVLSTKHSAFPESTFIYHLSNKLWIKAQVLKAPQLSPSPLLWRKFTWESSFCPLLFTEEDQVFVCLFVFNTSSFPSDKTVDGGWVWGSLAWETCSLFIVPTCSAPSSQGIQVGVPALSLYKRQIASELHCTHLCNGDTTLESWFIKCSPCRLIIRNLEGIPLINFQASSLLSLPASIRISPWKKRIGLKDNNNLKMGCRGMRGGKNSLSYYTWEILNCFFFLSKLQLILGWPIGKNTVLEAEEMNSAENSVRPWASRCALWTLLCANKGAVPRSPYGRVLCMRAHASQTDLAY